MEKRSHQQQSLGSGAVRLFCILELKPVALLVFAQCTIDCIFGQKVRPVLPFPSALCFRAASAEDIALLTCMTHVCGRQPPLSNSLSRNLCALYNCIQPHENPHQSHAGKKHLASAE